MILGSAAFGPGEPFALTGLIAALSGFIKIPWDKDKAPLWHSRMVVPIYNPPENPNEDDLPP